MLILLRRLRRAKHPASPDRSCLQTTGYAITRDLGLHACAPIRLPGLWLDGDHHTAHPDQDDLRSTRRGHPDAMTSKYSALCTKCLVVALAGCSLSVTANVRTKGRRPLVLACDIVTKLSASHRGVRTSEGVDLWQLRAMSLAVEASAADVPDNRPLFGRSATAADLVGTPCHTRSVR